MSTRGKSAILKYYYFLALVSSKDTFTLPHCGFSTAKVQCNVPVVSGRLLVLFHSITLDGAFLTKSPACLIFGALSENTPKMSNLIEFY